jgi:hypothetical protein
VFFSTTSNFFHQQIDIMLTKNGIHTLADVINADPMQVDSLTQSSITQGFAAFDVVQANKRSYCN